MRPKGCWPISSAIWVRIILPTSSIRSMRWARPRHSPWHLPLNRPSASGALFQRLDTIGEAAALSERLCAHLAKLKRLTHGLLATLTFFFTIVGQIAGECADPFQCSSSAVEGRHGYLSLYQHGHHHLSPRKRRC